MNEKHEVEGRMAKDLSPNPPHAGIDSIGASIRESAVNAGLSICDDLPNLLPDRRGRTSCPIVRWSGHPKNFIAVANAVGVKLIYLRERRFQLDGVIEESLENLTVDVQDEAWGKDSVEQRREQLYKATRPWKLHDDHVESVVCIWFCNGVAHELHLVAEWSSTFDDVMDEVLNESDPIGVSGSENTELAVSQETGDRALQLISHPRFAEATSEAKRQFLAEQLFPDQSFFEWQRIASQAALVYWWEVEPAERARIAQQVNELARAGASVTSIAGTLGISKERVRSFLGEANGDSQPLLL